MLKYYKVKKNTTVASYEKLYKYCTVVIRQYTDLHVYW